MTDEMTTLTEYLPATGETRQRPISKEDLEALFSGLQTTHVGPSEHGGLYTHTIEFPEATDEEREKIREEAQDLERQQREIMMGAQQRMSGSSLTAEEFARVYREFMGGIRPAEYQRQLLGMPAGTRFEEITVTNVTPDPEPNVIQRIVNWFTQPQVVNVTRAPRTTYDGSMLAAMCTAHRNAITGSPRRGGYIYGAFGPDYARMIRGSGIEAAEFGDGGGQRAGMTAQLGVMRGVRFIRSRPTTQEAQATWEEAVGIGVAS